jgi:MFS family permease
LALLVLAAGTIATYVRNYLTTFAQATLHLDTDLAFAATVAANAAAVAAFLYGGWRSDRVGRRPVMVGWNLAFLIAVYPAFLWIVEARSAVALLAGRRSSDFSAPWPRARSIPRSRKACRNAFAAAPSP